jgi:hypothetical protein
VRNMLKPVLEILAGVPTVVLGFFALTFITPALQFAFIPRPAIGPDGQPLLDAAGNIITQPWNPFGIEGYNILAAGIAVGILTLPIVTSLAEDALRAVPRQLREGSYGLGATRFETSIRVIFPAALSGIIAAMLLAIARCVGETMIVALAAGGTHLPLHHITEPPLVAHQWHVGTATIDAGESYVTPAFVVDDDEKIGPVRLEGSAEHLRIELLAANGDAIEQWTAPLGNAVHTLSARHDACACAGGKRRRRRRGRRWRVSHSHHDYQQQCGPQSYPCRWRAVHAPGLAPGAADRRAAIRTADDRIPRADLPRRREQPRRRVLQQLCSRGAALRNDIRVDNHRPDHSCEISANV